MTTPDIDALERAAMAATRGPWYQSGSPWFSTGSLVLSGSPDRHAGYMIVDTDPLDYREDIPDGEVADPEDDAAYIAAANPAAILSLIAEVRELRQERDDAGLRYGALETRAQQQGEKDGQRITDAEARAVEAERQRDEARAALVSLSAAETDYRHTHDLKGDGHILTGQAWDRMRRASHAARRALTALPPPAGSEPAP